ncbi:ArnT family glycosyltransferase [Xylanibacter muris]|uniref:Dolichyl-phosphate-mannose--protein mannosyltransferase n=1 Tax=Xylanibacter muris TaxID=2736290 RepID=A0ABX2AK94_9BACT|nr:glycosyltransferase family 39 protein [Xylanibacter muris]NPD90947.1 dolichyl-phosphate-mannose--protein mannosyltransferase [Xylanibacter muris]
MKVFCDNKVFWILFIICVITLLPMLGLSEFHTKGEPREAVVSYSMIAGNDWVSPRNNGGELAYKPPFFHWCVAAVSLMNGAVTEASSRMPSALALIIMTLAGYCFYARRKGRETALISALVAFTSFELHRAGANCRVDMVLTAMIVLSLYRLYVWSENKMSGVPWLAILFMSLGTLTKGPVGSVLPCLVTGVYLLLRGNGFFKVFFRLFVFGLLSLCMYGIWFYVAWKRGGQEFLDLMYEENIGRMTGTMTYSSHEEPWVYNILTVIAGYVPWTLLAVISLFYVPYRKLKDRVIASWNNPFKEKMAYCWEKLRQKVSAADDVDLFSFLSFGVIFVFYCIPESKRSVYLMPVYPFIGYFVARLMLWLTANRPSVLRVYVGILSSLAILLSFVFIIVKMRVIPESVFGGGRHSDVNVAMLHALENISSPIRFVLVSVPFVAGMAWWLIRKRFADSHRLIPAVFVMVFSLYLALDSVYIPTVLNCKSLKTVSAELDRDFPASRGVIYEYIDMGVKAKGNPMHFFEINFYLHNRVQNFYLCKPSAGFLLISSADAEKCFPDFERQGYRFRLCRDLRMRGIQLYEFMRQ